MSTYIDTHVHWCLFGRDPREVVEELIWLEENGFEALVFFPLPAMGAPAERALNLIPGAYREMTGIDQSRIVHDDLVSWRAFLPLWHAQPHKLRVLSFLDVRAWDGKSNLDAWWGEGHAGLKNIIIMEEDEAKMRMPALRHVPGITREEYLEAHRGIFSAAAKLGAPLVYHADLSLHSAFVEECLEANPGVRVSIPHFGFSRKRMAGLMKRFPGVMTDISSLRPFMDAEPEAYRSFIAEHPDRVMMGSDAIACHDLKEAMNYVRSVRKLGLGEEADEAVLRGNARRFLGDTEA